MILIMPMAGRGERFKQAGFTTPKPLIEISPGMPMYARATLSLPLGEMSEIVFVILREHCLLYGFEQEIRRRFGAFRIRIVVLDDVTSGQAETVALALDRSRSDEGLLVFNGDSAFEDDLTDWIRHDAPNCAGALQVFRDTDPRWSFAKVDSLGNVVETAEKKSISDLASTGLYYFRSWREYVAYYETLGASAGEKYIAPVYNCYLRDGKRIRVIPAKRYHCFGTPADYEACMKGKIYSY